MFAPDGKSEGEEFVGVPLFILVSGPRSKGGVFQRPVRFDGILVCGWFDGVAQVDRWSDEVLGDGDSLVRLELLLLDLRVVGIRPSCNVALDNFSFLLFLLDSVLDYSLLFGEELDLGFRMVLLAAGDELELDLLGGLALAVELDLDPLGGWHESAESFDLSS